MNDQQLRQAILEGATAFGEPLSAEQADRLVVLLRELERWGAKINLTAIREPADMVSGHILDSLAVRPLLEGKRIIDVGTGAGFPGLPLAICEPELDFELLDSNGKKIAFVQHAIAVLGLGNARAVKARAEDYAPAGGFDTVIARALAPIPRIIELAGHLPAGRGMLLALKGKYPAEELERAEHLSGVWETSVTELTVPGLAQHSRHAVCLRRKAG